MARGARQELQQATSTSATGGMASRAVILVSALLFSCLLLVSLNVRGETTDGAVGDVKASESTSLLQSLAARLDKLSMANGWHWEGPGETKTAFDKTTGSDHVAYGDFQFIEQAIAKVEMAASAVDRKARTEGRFTAEVRRMIGDLVILVTQLLHRESEFSATTAPPAMQGKSMGGERFHKQYGLADHKIHRAQPGFEATTATKHGVVSPPAPATQNATKLSAERVQSLAMYHRTEYNIFDPPPPPPSGMLNVDGRIVQKNRPQGRPFSHKLKQRPKNQPLHFDRHADAHPQQLALTSLRTTMLAAPATATTVGEKPSSASSAGSTASAASAASEAVASVASVASVSSAAAAAAVVAVGAAANASTAANATPSNATATASPKVERLHADMERLRDMLQAMRSLLYHGKGVPPNLISATKDMRAELEALIAHQYETITLRPTLSPDTTKSPTVAAEVVTYRY